MKSYQHRNFNILENIKYSSLATVTFMILVTSPGTMVHVMHVHFMFFVVLKILKSSFSEDNVPEHALDMFIENAIKMVWVIPLNAQNGDQTLR